MYQELQFRRQFLLAKVPITQLRDWACLQVDQYYLYTHPDLSVVRVEDRKKSIVLIGSIFDFSTPEKRNADIMTDILTGTNSMQEIFRWIKRYAGCYALFYKDDKDVFILNDARALREIYYCTENNEIICGSQPNLVARFSNPEIRPTKDPLLLDFYNNHLWDSRWVGDETFYCGIKHLIPNHYLNISRGEVLRYWPIEKINRIDLDEAVSRSCTFLQGIMSAIIHRHPVMMAVTAGTDSRTLLAASRGKQEKIYYFVNNQGLGYRNPDIAVPRKIFERIGVPFHVHDVTMDVDEDFRRIYFDNTFLATDRLLSIIYNVFFKEHAEKVCILGVGEIARTFYGKEPNNLNGYRMAYKLEYKNSRYAVKQCDKILNETLPVAKNFGLNVLTLLYWEQRLGNWGATRNSESGIAIEKIDPYDSHLLHEIFLGVDEAYRDYQQAPCVLFEKMIRNMWPELLELPINPAYSMRDMIQGGLTRIGIYDFLREMKYQVNYRKYRFKRWRNESNYSYIAFR